MTIETTPQTKVTSDFDFLVGSWDVEHRRLVNPLTGSDEWETETNSTTSGWTYLDGSISLDEIAFPAGAGTGCRCGCTPRKPRTGRSGG